MPIRERVISRVIAAAQEHRQAVDPNLVQLAAAYREAKAQLGNNAVPSADGGSEDEEDMAADADGISGIAEDAHEGLKAIATPLTHAADVAAITSVHPAEPAAEPLGRDALLAATRSTNGHVTWLQPGHLRNAAARAAVQPGFIAADAFCGARPGYVFRVGSRGTGYYQDVGGTGAVSKPRRKAAGAGETIGGLPKGVPNGDATAGGDGSDEGRGRSAARGAIDDTDSEHEGNRRSGRAKAGVAQKGKGDRKALPGRLRKKLARERDNRKFSLLR